MPRLTTTSVLNLTLFLASTRAVHCDDRDILAGQHVLYSYPTSSQLSQGPLDLTRAGAEE